VERIDPQPGRFYDGGVPAAGGLPELPANPDLPPRIVLARTADLVGARFRMERRIGYRDRHVGDILVPAGLGSFATDLASVPALFTWLVPKDGNHLPAALLHDGLQYSPGEEPSYVSVEGHDIDAIEANRVFRDAMCDTGTGTVRRWLMWAAVTVASLVTGRGVAMSRGTIWRYRVAVVGTVAVVVVLGVLATLDLFDVDGPLPQVPWMPEGGFVAELARGVAGALVVPFVLAATWGRFWQAGVIAALSLAVLLHVTVALVAITAVYQAAERLTGRLPVVAAVGAAAVVAAALVVFVTALV